MQIGGGSGPERALMQDDPIVRPIVKSHVILPCIMSRKNSLIFILLLVSKFHLNGVSEVTPDSHWCNRSCPICKDHLEDREET